MISIFFMKITLNNREEEFDFDKMTISDLLKEKKFTFKMLVIRVNNQPVLKNEYDKRFVFDGDNVTVLHLVSGG